MDNSFEELKKHRSLQLEFQLEESEKKNAQREREMAVRERELKLKEDSAKFDFKMKQLNAYEDLKKKGYSKNKIVRIFHELKEFVDAESDNDENSITNSHNS